MGVGVHVGVGVREGLDRRGLSADATLCAANSPPCQSRSMMGRRKTALPLVSAAHASGCSRIAWLQRSGTG